MKFEPVGEHPSIRQLSEFLSSEVVDEMCERISLHIDNCDNCQERLEILSSGSIGLRRHLSELSSWPEPNSQTQTTANQCNDTRISIVAELDFERGDEERFSVNDPIAAGGMGVVYRGFDSELQREVAIKVIAPAECEQDQAIAETRFQREAIISGQLQHPGVVPIHKLGKLKNGRMFIAMKLVQGQTLAELIKGQDRTPIFVSRLMDIFGQVCQTIAYAHSRDIIHRDLKPQNIMIGSFGESQVMDWGLAKQLRDDEEVEISENVSTAVPAVPAIPGATQNGVVIGTPAYMAPEQRAGKPVDQRVDVFSLGGILCEILTGKAPFANSQKILGDEISIKKKLSFASERMDSSLADKELIQLAKDCLEYDPVRRPFDAREISMRLNDYVYRRDELLLQSELDRARSQTRLVVEQKRRKQILVLGTVVATFFLCTTIASCFYWSEKNARQEDRYRAERETTERLLARDNELRDVLQKAETLFQQALVADVPNQDTVWARTMMQIRKAEGLVDELVSADILLEFKQLKKDVEQYSDAADCERHQRIKDEALCEIIHSSMLDSFFQNRGMWYGEEPDFLGRLEDAFGQYGIEVFDDTDSLVQMIHESRISDELLLGLQHWQSQFFWLELDREKTKLVRSWFRNMLNAADTDPDRIRIRNLLFAQDVPALLAEMKNPQSLESIAAVRLILDGTRRLSYNELPALLKDGYWKTRYDYLLKAYVKYPGEFSVNFLLGIHCLGDGTPRRELDLEKAVEHLMICYALEPQCPGVLERLADAYTRLKDVENAFAYGEKLIQLFPEMAESHYVVALHCSTLGRNELAISAAQRAIELDPQFVPPYNLLCQIHLAQKNFERATYYGEACLKARSEHSTAIYWAQEVARQSQLARQADASNDGPKVRR